MKTTLRTFTAVILVMAPVCLFAQFTKLYDFSQQSGREPYGSLILDESDQVLYGLTYEGGANDDGTLFKYDLASEVYTRLVDFDTPDGTKPRGSLLKVGSRLFGMTSDGGPNGVGTIFKVFTDGSDFHMMFPFETSGTGETPFGSLILIGDLLYGMTYDGGANGHGTIFWIDTNATNFSVIHEFTGDDGSGPYGELFYDGYYLYGMTKYGGTGNFGVIFKLNISSLGYTKLLDFDWTDMGGYPDGSLTLYNGDLYGMTSTGGAHSDGTIFKKTTSGSGFTKIFDFQGSVSGEAPWGSLVYYNGFLYGQAGGNGTLHNGSLFRILPDGSNFTTLYAFTDPLNGKDTRGTPVVTPTFDGAILYGMMQTGGTNDYGVIFRYFDLWEGIGSAHGDQQVSVFPNPAKDVLHVRASVPVTEVTVCGLLGNEVYRTACDAREISVPVSNLSSGLYIVKIKGNDFSLTEKFIRE